MTSAGLSREQSSLMPNNCVFFFSPKDRVPLDSKHSRQSIVSLRWVGYQGKILSEKEGTTQPQCIPNHGIWAVCQLHHCCPGTWKDRFVWRKMRKCGVGIEEFSALCRCIQPRPRSTLIRYEQHSTSTAGYLWKCKPHLKQTGQESANSITFSNILQWA